MVGLKSLNEYRIEDRRSQLASGGLPAARSEVSSGANNLWAALLEQIHSSTLSRIFLQVPSKSKLGDLIQDRFARNQQVGSGF